MIPHGNGIYVTVAPPPFRRKRAGGGPFLLEDFFTTYPDMVNGGAFGDYTTAYSNNVIGGGGNRGWTLDHTDPTHGLFSVPSLGPPPAGYVSQVWNVNSNGNGIAALDFSKNWSIFFGVNISAAPLGTPYIFSWEANFTSPLSDYEIVLMIDPGGSALSATVSLNINNNPDNISNSALFTCLIGYHTIQLDWDLASKTFNVTFDSTNQFQLFANDPEFYPVGFNGQVSFTQTFLDQILLPSTPQQTLYWNHFKVSGTSK